MPTCMSAAPRSADRAVLGRKTQASLVRAQRVPETTLLDPDVSKGDGATDGVGEVAGRLQVRHGVGPCAVRCVEIPGRPVREGEEPRCRSATQVVVVIDEVERSRRRTPSSRRHRHAGAPVPPGTRRSPRAGGGTPLHPPRSACPIAALRRPSASADMSSHRSASRRRASAPSSWPLSRSSPA